MIYNYISRMFCIFIKKIILLSCIFIFFATSVYNVFAFNKDERLEIHKIIREYLLKNPELLLEVQQELQDLQSKKRALMQKKTLKQDYKKIFESENQSFIGNRNAAITIVAFFDYNCSFCKSAFFDMEKIIHENKDVKFVMKEFPVLGKESVLAHRISIAFGRLAPQKYENFHKELMHTIGNKGEKEALQIAEKMGENKEKLEMESKKPYVTEAIQDTYEIAQNLGIGGTPSYIIGDEVIFGAVGHDSLKRKIKNIRKCGKTNC